MIVIARMANFDNAQDVPVLQHQSRDVFLCCGGERDILPGAEPFFMPGGKRGVLLVHGFTGLPAELLLMGHYLHERGFTVLESGWRDMVRRLKI